MATQRHAYNHRSIGGHSAQSWIPRKKSDNTFLVIAFCDLKAFNSMPQGNRRIVIVARKFSRRDRILHMGANDPIMHQAFLPLWLS
jgi:hypothetical protein